MPENIALVGVGRMGSNMARRLKDQGFAVTAVFDLNTELAKALAQELGCAAPATMPEVTAAADVIITVVSDDEAMDDIFGSVGCGCDSLLGTASGVTVAEGKLFINCATVSPGTHELVESRATEAGAQSMEACMASSITQAREGTLYLMCGGKPETFERAKPILEKLSSSLRYIGPTGSAAKVKALVNMVMNINTAGLAEGLGLADALGLDLSTVREVFSQTGAASRVLVTDGEDMQNREHSCYFSGAHAAKDSTIAVLLAREQHLELPLAEATKAQYDKMVFEGLGELDKSGIAELTFKGRHHSD
jgi:3-hydroxyisobutyrate dehydrogenase